MPITVPADGRPRTGQLVPEDHDHIPFWASWETDTYMVVDQDAFEKACNQAIIAGWDGKLGSKGSAVTELQKLLIKNGMTGKNKKPLIADGDFGENTEYAVIQFQKLKILVIW